MNFIKLNLISPFDLISLPCVCLDLLRLCKIVCSHFVNLLNTILGEFLLPQAWSTSWEVQSYLLCPNPWKLCALVCKHGWPTFGSVCILYSCAWSICFVDNPFINLTSIFRILCSSWSGKLTLICVSQAFWVARFYKSGDPVVTNTAAKFKIKEHIFKTFL